VPGVRYPGLQVAARIPNLPMTSDLKVDLSQWPPAEPARDATPCLQWRHRVGLAPTSRDRRAERTVSRARSGVECPASIAWWIVPGFGLQTSGFGPAGGKVGDPEARGPEQRCKIKR
jgi:hypothetical protein